MWIFQSKVLQTHLVLNFFRSFKSSTCTSKKKIETPIYSSVLKKKSNPARDFALTVLENDKKNVVKLPENLEKSSDLNEISKLLNSTSALLTRNSHLRASLTIKVQRSNSKKSTKTTFVLPKNAEEKPQEVLTPLSTPSSDSSSSDKCDTSEEESMPSLEPTVNPFSRWMTFLTLPSRKTQSEF